MSPHSRRLRQQLLFFSPAAIFLALMAGYPLYMLVRMSVSSVEIQNFLGSWPVVGFDNFRSLPHDRVFVSSLVRTGEYLAVLVVATLVVGLLIALVLQVDRTLTRFTQAVLILVWMMPPVILGSLWKFLAASDGVFNSYALKLNLIPKPVPIFAEPDLALWGVAAVSLWVSLPFAAIVIKAALLDVPSEVLDAARVDGANALQTLSYVVIPMIRPTLLILSVLTIVFAFKSFEYFYVLTQGGPGTASTILPYYGYVEAFQGYHFSSGAAIAVICIAMTSVLAVFYAQAIRHEDRAA